MTIQNLVQCNNKGLGYYHIWYLYVQVTLQLLQVLGKENKTDGHVIFCHSAKSSPNILPERGQLSGYNKLFFPQVLNSSQNLLIYWFVGSGFKTTAKKYLRYLPRESNINVKVYSSQILQRDPVLISKEFFQNCNIIILKIVIFQMLPGGQLMDLSATLNRFLI